MTPGMFVVTTDGSLNEVFERPYDSEALLQGLLESHPGLLVGDTTGAPGARRYLLIKREAGVPAAEGGTDRWAIDHLFVDQDGVPTLVEVKRSTDTRIRREVVGQMLDYAANILAHWPVERVREEFEDRCVSHGLDPGQELGSISESPYEDYWRLVQTNLAARRLRLLFVADEIPTTLQTIVEFLSAQMSPTEVLAIEVKQHVGDQLMTYVTRAIGPTASGRQLQAAQAGGGRSWDEQTIFDELAADQTPAVIASARTIFDHVSDYATPGYGRGERTGVVWFTFRQGKTSSGPFGFNTKGSFNVYPQQLAKLEPFDERDARVDFLNRLNEAAGWHFEEGDADRSYPHDSLQQLADPGRLTKVLETLDWLNDRVRGSTTSS